MIQQGQSQCALKIFILLNLLNEPGMLDVMAIASEQVNPPAVNELVGQPLYLF